MELRTFPSRHLLATLVFTFLYFQAGSALVAESDLLPFSASAGSTQFSFSDDGYTGIDLSSYFNFLGTRYSRVYISGNGIITFGEGKGAYSYRCNKTAATVPTISVHMADARDDDRGKLLYRQDTSSSSLAKVSRDVFLAFPELRGTLNLNWMLIVTWYNIPPFSTNYVHLRNTYQAVLTTDGVQSFVLFYFNRITWPIPDPGWLQAETGIYGGPSNLQNFFLNPTSCNHSLANSTYSSNIGIPGKFVFKVDNSLQLPSLSSCVPKVNPTDLLKLQPAVIPVIGSVPLLVQNLNLCPSHIVTSATCTFHDTSRKTPVKMEGTLLPDQLAVVCPTPPEFYSLGRTRVDVSLDFNSGENFSSYGYINVVKTQSEPNLHLYTRESSNGSRQLEASWAPDTVGEMKEIADFYNSTLRTDITSVKTGATNLSITVMELSGNRWRELYTVRNVPNNGSWSGELPEHVESMILSKKLESPPRTLKISSTIGLVNGTTLKTEHVTDITEITYRLAKLKTSSRGDQVNVFDKKCKQWFDHEPSPPTDTLPCPVTMQQALADWRFSQETTEYPELMNPLNFSIFLQVNPSPSGAGSQCSYDSRGNLVVGFPYGSRLHRRSPNNKIDPWSYYWEDVLPYLQCCHLSHSKKDNCKKYFFNKRPTYDGTGYKSPQPFRVTGASHISTFDGATYLLNGIGTFWMVKYPGQVDMQILLEKYRDSAAPNTTTTVVTSAVISAMENGTRTKIQVSASNSSGLFIWVDDEPANFYGHGINKEQSEALFTFSSGLSVKFILSSGNLPLPFLNIIGSASTAEMDKVSGLLGNYDGDSDNDLATANGTLLSSSSTLAEISKQYAEQWRVPQNESLFLFPSGKSYPDYNNFSDFQPSQSSTNNILARARRSLDFCEDVEDCQIDFELTDNAEFANVSIAAYLEYETLLNTSQTEATPLHCGPPGTFLNGGFSGGSRTFSSNVGAIIQAYCDDDYHLRVHQVMASDEDIFESEEGLSQIPAFICVADELVDPNMVQGATWISDTSSQSIANYSFECIQQFGFDKSENEEPAETANTTQVEPAVVSILGNIPMFITIPHRLDESDLAGITCIFTSAIASVPISTEGVVLEVFPMSSNVMCPVPVLPTLGRMMIRLEIQNLGKVSLHFGDSFWVEKWDDTSSELEVSTVENHVNVFWNASNFEEDGDDTSCELNFQFAKKNDKFFTQVDTSWSSLCNSEGYNDTVESTDPIWGTMKLQEIYSTPAILTLQPTSNTSLSESLASSNLLSGIMTVHDVIMAQNSGNSTAENDLDARDDNENHYDFLCEQWYNQERTYAYTKDILPCPPSLKQARVDWRFTPDTRHNTAHLNPGAAKVFIQSTPSLSKSGSQCAYDDNGRLIYGHPAGSRVHRFNPNGWDNYWNHFTHDTLPYLYCCKWSSNPEHSCPSYFYEKRGIPINKRYSPPTHAYVGGANHIHTFDGAQYRFNGVGEFWMMKYESSGKWNHLEQFSCQARLEPFVRAGVSEESSPRVTVLTAMTMHQNVHGSQVTVQVSRAAAPLEGFDVFVDDEVVETDLLTTLHHAGVTVFFNKAASPELIVVFQTGFSFKFAMADAEVPGMNVIFSAGQTALNKTVGLLGNFDGDDTNDFVTPSGTVISNNSTLTTIHDEFGMTWLVKEEESLFSYHPSESYAQFYRPEIEPLEFLPVSDFFRLPISKVYGFWENSREFMFDFLTTGSEAFAKAGKESYNSFKEIIAASKEEAQLGRRSIIIDSLTEGTTFRMQFDGNGRLGSANVNVRGTCNLHL